VEVDGVMPGETPLWRAHDISQVLQDKLEVLPGVEGHSYMLIMRRLTLQNTLKISEDGFVTS